MDDSAAPAPEQPFESKRILFVDDEPQVLEGLRSVFRKERRRWHMLFALGGDDALRALRAAPVDVIVSDMRMPGMDGATLLRRVRDEFPAVIRVILSGQGDREAFVRALPVSHQFLSKPCDDTLLRDVIARACALQTLIGDDSLRQLVGKTDKLPSLPRIYWELTQALSDAAVSPKRIATIVEQDPALCATFLHLANSAYFHLAHRIRGVEQAVVYLGLELVRSLVLSAQVFSVVEKSPAIPGFSFELFQEQCLLTARVARQIPIAREQQEEAFTAALLHDLGILVLALSVPEQVTDILTRSQRVPEPLHLLERERLGASHAGVGAYLLGLWGLPLSVVEAVAYHHTPMQQPKAALGPLAAVHIADALVDSCIPTAARVTEHPPLDLDYVERVGCAAQLPRWAELARREAKQWGTRLH